MKNTMEQLWKRIQAWFEANVPPENFRLNRGATEYMLKITEEVLQVHFPPDVRESYLIHNGMQDGALYLNQHLSTLEEVKQYWGIMSGQGSDYWEDFQANPEGPIKPVWWNRKWIPITDSGGGSQLLVDMDPAEGGKVGQIIDYHHETGPICVLAPGFREWLTQFADDLEAGKYCFDEYGFNIERRE